jgi:hypothetical protein
MIVKADFFKISYFLGPKFTDLYLLKSKFLKSSVTFIRFGLIEK